MDKTLKVFAQTLNLTDSKDKNYYAPLLKVAKYTNVNFYENSRYIIRLVNLGGADIAYGEVYIATGKGTNSGKPFITAKYLVKPNFDCFIAEESDSYILYVKANLPGTKVIVQVLYATNISFLEAINFEKFAVDKTSITNTITEFINFNSDKFPSDSYFITNTSETSNMYAKIGKIKITVATKGVTLGLQISERDNGEPTVIAGTVYFKARKQTSSNPTLVIKSAGITSDFTFANINIIGVIIDETTIELYVQIKTHYTGFIFRPFIWDYTDNGTTVELYGEQTLVSSLPTGTQVSLFTS